MQKTAKLISLALLGLLIVFIIIIKFSEVETRYSCVGEFSKDGKSNTVTIFFKLTQYRPWVNIWSDSDGYINLEYQDQFVDYFRHVEKVGDKIKIFKTHPEKVIVGDFSLLSKSLIFDSSIYGIFRGSCIENYR